jgi:hypothetical protein
LSNRGRVAGLATIGAVALILVVQLLDAPERRATKATPLLPAMAPPSDIALPVAVERPRDVDDVDSSEAEEPQPLVTNGASLLGDYSGDGFAPESPILSLARADGTWHQKRRITEALPGWRSLPAGRYTLEAVGDGWEVGEKAFELSAGDARTVRVVARTAVRVRVVGVRTGNPLTTYRLAVDARWAGGADAQRLMATFDVANAGGMCRLRGLPLHSAGQPLDALRVAVLVPGKEDIESPWLPAAQLLQDAELVLHVPEPAIVGCVSAADGCPSAAVYLVPADQAFDALGLAAYLLPESLHGATVLDTTTTEDGAFEFRMTELPEGPVRVCAFDASHAPADSGPLVIPASGLPLRVDLVLPEAGAIRGMIRGPLGYTVATMAPQTSFMYSSVTATPVENMVQPRGIASYLGLIAPGGSATTPRAAVPAEFDIGGLPAGDYEVIAWLAGNDRDFPQEAVAARRLVAHASVAAGEVTEIVLEPDDTAARATLSGSLLSPSGFKANRAAVVTYVANHARPRPVLVASVSAAGTFAMFDLPRESLIVCAQQVAKSGQGMAVAAIELDQGEATQPVLLDTSTPACHIAWPGRTSGHVDVEAGAGLSAAALRLLEFGVYVELDESGNATLFGLPPGAYVARFDDDALVPFAVRAGIEHVAVEHP